MSRGGKRPGAGRKPGMMTATRKAILDRTNMALAAEQTPLEVILQIMRNAASDDDRLKAAIAAAPYVHPRLAAVEHSGDKDNPVSTHTRIEMVVVDAASDDDNPSARTAQASPAH